MPTCYRHPGRETYIRCQRCDRPICPDCMRDAAVGFQCPNCIAEGAKSTRSGRAAYGGRRSTNPAATSIALVGINVGVWLIIIATGWRNSYVIERLALLPVGRCMSESNPGARYPTVLSEQVCNTVPNGDGLWFPGVSDGAYWQLITNAFTHVEVWHMGFNMLALWVLGPQLELAIGRARFLALYIMSALAGSALVYSAGGITTATLGASAAVFGLMGALLVLALKVGGNVQQILMWIGINFLITVVWRGTISWQGHLGGFLGGVLIALVLVYAPRNHRTLWQVAGLSLLGAGLVATILVRTAALT